nr:PD-(D/E)XK nuclease family protein [Cryobacterium sp. BB736]
MVWPLDPLGGRRPTIERAADLVRAARPGAAGQWESYLDLLLEERRRLEQTGGLTELPVRISASRFKDYVTDPASVAEELRRPMPARPYRATRLGTLFHSWVEERSGLGAASELIDSLDFGLDPDDVGVEQEQLARLQEIFERSPFASLKPVEVERELHLPFEDRIVICKIDAVYEQDGRFRVVDWKTGKAPKSAEELELRQLQLALYRLAFARWKGIDPSLVDAVFYYVADDLILEPDRLFDEEELRALWRRTTQPPR